MIDYEMPRQDVIATVPRWSSLDEAIVSHAALQTQEAAFIEPGGHLTWGGYDDAVTLMAAELIRRGLAPRSRVLVWIPDGAAVHVAMAACTRAGMVCVGLGSRTGPRELEALAQRCGAVAMLTAPVIGQTSTSEVFRGLQRTIPGLAHYIDVTDVVPPLVDRVETFGTEADLDAARNLTSGLRIPVDELSMINSTSGTTGLPKCVAHDERRWLKYHEYAVDAAELRAGEPVMTLVPAPFGFGLWTGHFTPTLLGSPLVVMPRFDASTALDLLERHRVSVLMAVSTQFILLLEDPTFEDRDLSSLRVLFTGGEAVPQERAASFEERTGAMVLNMYGSNETGVLSYTRVTDSRDRRLSTGGRIIPEVQVRLFGPDGQDLRLDEGPAQPGAIGDVQSLGYFNDPPANEQLYTADGWMLMGDLVEIDAEGYLTVVGRTSDIIIRGGKNLSAAAIEREVATHPSVAHCAAVAVPDPIFGERVAMYVELRPNTSLDLEDLRGHLSSRGVSKEWYPERLITLDELPISEGGKVAKGALRDDVRRRAASDSATA